MMRYSEQTFPEYRYRPKVTPHPIRDPAGHSYGKASNPATINETTWADCEPYLFAADLFNHGYYWEAHEELEALWLGTGRDTEVGRFLQGIIQAAAALLKIETQKQDSAARLVSTASSKLREPQRILLGLDGEQLAMDLAQAMELGNASLATIVLSKNP